MKIYMKRMFQKMLLISLICIAAIALNVVFYLQQPQFGKLPKGARLDKIKNSPNYADEKFNNLIFTPKLVENNSQGTILWDFLFVKKERLRPNKAIHAIKTDLKNLDKIKDVIIWLGHSSYFMQIGGKRILIDPVLSLSASPITFTVKAFEGSAVYAADDLGDVDYLLISHDHWDHLDYPALIALKSKVKNIVCPLGVGAYFEQWGFDAKIIHEADWFTALEIEKDFNIHVLPARHFSGRLLKENQTLWAAFALITPNLRIFYSGDSGYGPHFKQIGEQFSYFDLAIMENGQYDKNWPYIHMMPEEVPIAAEDLGTIAVLPAHSGKFSISNHSWDDPLKRIALASQNKNYRLITPKIGEIVEIKNKQQVFSRWWEDMD